MMLPILFLMMVSSSWSRLADDMTDSSPNNNCITEHCFYQPVEECPSPESKCRCRQLPHCTNAVVCCNVNKFQLTEGLACTNISANGGKVEALHIRNATLDVMNVEEWKRLRLLRYLAITDGQINSVVGEFMKHTVVSCLNLSSNGIVNFENRSLVNLYSLRFLDLSNNNLSDVPRFRKEGNVTLDISGNKNMQCPFLSDALKRSELYFRNENATYCSSASSFHWFNSTDILQLSQIITIHELGEFCKEHLKNCTCHIRGKDVMDGKAPIMTAAVNCSGQQLISLPTPLPLNTISLYISNNNITSLDLLSTDASYEQIRELDANNNQISSILPLEGTHFISNFVGLSLRNNKIRSLPTYILSNIFNRIDWDRTVYLGLNRLHCDCNTARVLKVWLLTKVKNIPDYAEIYCENINEKVINLNPTTLCQSQQDWTDYIYYIITAEVVLLVGLIAKVIYDYCVFKTSGTLPWPASKMPKLPCDWLCE